MATRKVIKVSVTPAAKRAIEETAKSGKHREILVVSELIEWFAKQPDVVRRSILGTLPKGFEVDVAKLALERIASGDNKS